MRALTALASASVSWMTTVSTDESTHEPPVRVYEHRSVSGQHPEVSVIASGWQLDSDTASENDKVMRSKDMSNANV